MPQRTLTLIRHGQCIQEGEDPPLTLLGRQQATITANVFKGHEVETIHYSTLRRSRETAEIIAHQLSDAKMIGYESLWEGIPTIPPQFREIFEEQARKNPDFRSTDVLNARMRLDEAYARIFRPAEDRDVHDLIICHGNVLRYFVCRALNVDVHTWVQFHPPANCSLTQIIIAPHAIKEALDAGITLTTLVTFNETRHLRQELRTPSTKCFPVEGHSIMECGTITR
jgi:serine/threonine-protein phosphatase PGAM5